MIMKERVMLDHKAEGTAAAQSQAEAHTHTHTRDSVEVLVKAPPPRRDPRLLLPRHPTTPPPISTLQGQHAFLYDAHLEPPFLLSPL